jgi:hypothetical protein
MNIRTLFNRRKNDEVTAVDPELDATARQAYERGRRDERARQTRRRRGFPLITLLLLVIAGAGVTAVYLGVQQGSFARGGQVVDQNIANVGQTVTNTAAVPQQAVRSAADEAANKLQEAGQQIKHAAGS